MNFSVFTGALSPEHSRGQRSRSDSTGRDNDADTDDAIRYRRIVRKTVKRKERKKVGKSRIKKKERKKAALAHGDVRVTHIPAERVSRR